MILRRGHRTLRATALDPDGSGDTDARALSAVVAALQELMDRPGDDLQPLLELVRTAFGMDYASAWAQPTATDEGALDPDGRGLAGRGPAGWRCIAQSGSLGSEFAELTARFVDAADGSQGMTSCGVAVSRGAPVVVDDLAALATLPQQPQFCERGRAAVAAGSRATFSFPVVRHGQVAAVFDFLSRTPLSPSPARPT